MFCPFRLSSNTKTTKQIKKYVKGLKIRNIFDKDSEDAGGFVSKILR